MYGIFEQAVYLLIGRLFLYFAIIPAAIIALGYLIYILWKILRGDPDEE